MVARPAPTADRGLKRRCTDCGTAFYDLGRRPIVCPKCGSTHEPQVLLKSDGRLPRKSRVPPPPPPVVETEPAPESEEEALPDEVADDDEGEVEEPVEGEDEDAIDQPDNDDERER